jgi:hypothetical protein
MRTSCRFAYAQARLQARFALLPADEEWQRLNGSRTLAGFLEEARSGVLRDWIRPFSGQSDSHDLEVGLRALFREQVSEVAGWLPHAWRAAMIWTRWLVLLPLFEHLARGEGMPAWAAGDHDLRPLLDEQGGLSRERLRVGGADVLTAHTDAAAVWLEEWHGRWPSCRPEFLRNLRALECILSGHLEAFRGARTEGAWRLRSALRERLGVLFHRYLLQPAGAFAFIAISALEMERLRSELVTRALFAPRESA